MKEQTKEIIEQMQVAADFGYSKALTEIRQYCIEKRRELTESQENQKK